jgi:hypothetical protein
LKGEFEAKLTKDVPSMGFEENIDRIRVADI